jgi:hypothetical protein
MAVAVAFSTNASLTMFTVNPFLFFEFAAVSLRPPEALLLHPNEMTGG